MHLFNLDVRCKNCDHLLAHIIEAPDPDWYGHLRSDFKGRCPKCGHELPLIEQFLRMMDIKVSPRHKRVFKRK